MEIINHKIMRYLQTIALLLATAGLMSCGSGEKNKTNDTVHSVEVITPMESSVDDSWQFTGTVKSNQEINLGFKTPGQIIAVYVKEGQHISKGQLLARLDAKDYQLGVDAARIQYNQLKDEVARLKKLYQAKGLSGNDYEKAVAGLEQVGVNLQTNKNKLGYTRLYAPVSGVVKSVNFERSEMVNAGTPVFSILSQGQKEIEVSLPQSAYLQRRNFRGYHAVINGRSYVLSLRNIVPDADNVQLFKAIFLLTGAGSEVSDGMSANVLISTVNSWNAGKLSLPEHCLFQKGGQSYVWLVGKDGRVRSQQVSIVEVGTDGNAVVSGSIPMDARIVKAGVEYLQENEKVTIVAHPTQTNIGNII